MRRNHALLAAGATMLAGAYLVRKSTVLDLQDKVVLITGGSRGLGLELAREFGRHGSRVVICARNIVELERAQRDLESRGIRALAIRCDITERTDVLRMFAQIHTDDRFGEVDILVNNAGVIEVGPLEAMRLEDFEEAMNTHFWGPLYTTLAALPRMKARGKGSIVNITSIGGKISPPHLLPYNASKFALVGLSEGLRAELSKDGIRVTIVCPGLMTTGSPRNATFKGQHAKEYAWFSVSDSLPLVAMDSRRAARKIVDACRHGSSELILTPQAKLAVMLNGLLPGLIPDAMRMVNAVLPSNGPAGSIRMKGHETASFDKVRTLTPRDEAAARRNNETEAA